MKKLALGLVAVIRQHEICHYAAAYGIQHRKFHVADIWTVLFVLETFIDEISAGKDIKLLKTELFCGISIERVLIYIR